MGWSYVDVPHIHLGAEDELEGILRELVHGMGPRWDRVFHQDSPIISEWRPEGVDPKEVASLGDDSFPFLRHWKPEDKAVQVKVLRRFAARVDAARSKRDVRRFAKSSDDAPTVVPAAPRRP